MLRQFEVQGVYPLNESVAIGRSRDKLRALQLLAREGIGCRLPRLRTARAAEDVIKEVGGAPCVIKLLEGAQGRGVILAETTASAQIHRRGVQCRKHEHPRSGVHQGGRRHRHPRAGVGGLWLQA